MTLFDRQILAAEGCIELDMPAEAQEIIRDLEACDERESLALLRVQAAAFTDLRQWEQLESVVQQLYDRQREDWRWPIMLATAKRKVRSLEGAHAVLLQAINRLPQSPLMHYNLACYQAQLGQLEAARASLSEAIRLNETLTSVFMNDPDLAPLRQPLDRTDVKARTA